MTHIFNNGDYKKIISLMKENKISKIKDLQKFGDTISAWIPNKEDDGCGWSLDLYSAVRTFFENQRVAFFRNDSEYFVTHNSNIESRKYLCLFPSSSVILTKALMSIATDDNNNYFCIPVDFLRELLINKEFIENNIFTVLPEYYLHDAPTHHGYILTLNPNENNGYSNFNKSDDHLKTGIYVDNDIVEKLFFTFPWLYGARAEDFLDIVEKNNLYFMNYCNTINKFVRTLKEGQIKDLFYEMKEAHVMLQIEFEKAREQLFKKGIVTTVGLACTFIPLFLDIPAEIKAALSSILGATTTKELLSLFATEKNNLKNVGVNNPFWVTWQWEKNYK